MLRLITDKEIQRRINAGYAKGTVAYDNLYQNWEKASAELREAKLEISAMKAAARPKKKFVIITKDKKEDIEIFAHGYRGSDFFEFYEYTGLPIKDSENITFLVFDAGENPGRTRVVCKINSRFIVEIREE